MAKFSTGLLLGAVAGTVYGLLTATRTGRQTQQSLADFVTGVAAGTTAVTTSVTHLKQAGQQLQHTLSADLAPAMAGIEDAVNDFQFQTQPQLTQIGEHLDRIDAAVSDLTPDDPQV